MPESFKQLGNVQRNGLFELCELFSRECRVVALCCRLLTVDFEFSDVIIACLKYT